MIETLHRKMHRPLWSRLIRFVLSLVETIA